MLNYITLKSDSKLPLSGKFIDPYDHEEFYPREGEPLLEFTKRIRTSRVAKKAPEPTDVELRTVVIECLYETSATHDKRDLFHQQQANPTFGQMLSAAKSIVSQIKNPQTIPLRVRQKRAKEHCLNNCALHNRTRSWTGRSMELVEKVAGIAELGTYPEEAKLGTCNMCGCGLAAKLKFSADSALVGLLPEQIDVLIKAYGVQSFSRCWILKEALQNPTTRETLRKKLAAGRTNGVHLMNDHLKAAPKDAKEKI